MKVIEFIIGMFAINIEREEDEDGYYIHYKFGIAHFIIVPALIYLAFFA